MAYSKNCLVFVNIVYFLLSFVFLIMGAVTYNSMTSNYSLFRELVTPAIITMVFGVSLTFLALSTVISVFYHNRDMLTVNVGTLVILLVIQLCFGVAAFVNKSQVIALLTKTMRSGQSVYLEDSSANSTWNALQQDFQCCGVYNNKEWFRYLDDETSLPDSCCIHYTTDCGREANATGDFFQAGCAKAVSTWVNRQELPVATLFAFLLFFQVLSIFYSKWYIEETEQIVSYHAYRNFF